MARETWPEAKGPLMVPSEGGVLHWFILNRGNGNSENPIAGPYSVTIAPLSGARKESSLGRIACRNYGKSDDSRWEYVSGLLHYVPGIVKNRNVDVCDGEDLEWAFVSSDGNILEQQRRDRLAPAAPLLDSPPEGGWTRGPVKVNVIPDEKEDTGIVTARLRYASGEIEILSGTNSLEIASSRGELAEVTVESLLVDISGNRGPKTIRHFTVDPKTIYVSALPLMSGAPNGSASRGGMDDPFSSLEEALDFAVTHGLKDIRTAGTIELRKPIMVSGNICIDGSWRREAQGNTENKDAGAVLVLDDGFFWNIESGADLILSRLRVERKGGDNPLIQAGKNGRLEIDGTTINNAGPFLSMDEANCGIRDSRILIRVTGERRIAAITARSSGIELNGSRIQLEANYGLLFDLEGGGLSAFNCVFLAAGGRTAALFSLHGSRLTVSNLTVQAAARDYASILEASGSELVLSGGILEVSARDVTAFLFDNSSCLIHDAQIRVEGAFSVRAAEIRGAFPLVRNSRFYSTGSAKRSDVFSGMEAAVPQTLGITGNRFSGFTNIWGEGWPMDMLRSFNQAYASPAEPNVTQSAGKP